MAQSSYTLNQAAYALGQKANTKLSECESMISPVVVPIGSALVKYVGSERTCRLPVSNIATVTIAGTYTAGTISVVVGGVTVSQGYDTDKTTTLTALAAQIALLSTVSSCTWVLGTTLFTITMKNLAAPTAFLGTLTGTILPAFVSSSNDVVYGFAINDGSVVADANGLVAFAVDQPISVLRKGSVAVFTEQAVTSDDAVFIRFTANGAGKTVGHVRKDVDTDKAIASTLCKFKTSASAESIVVVEINLP